ncbi:MAG: hypothetical protein JWQ89_2472 [Devosia sp.]|uniref:acyl carrier protein n=1 Tax=Devosia sp. TaxID=1871048 RepID=UPI00262120EE|nr:phosphopantetheine-binding protein [Devosia sp.]MDB5540745.1 hypothetical protein [Devosia sp.]
MPSDGIACEIVGRALGVDTVAPDDDMQSLPAWDSLGHMAIVAEIERTIRASLQPDDIVSIASVNDVLELLRRLAPG